MASPPDSALVRALRQPVPNISVELRPPRAELDAAAGRDAWIDTYHAVRGLVRSETFVFLTDSAVGAREEHNLRHLVINLGTDVPRDRVVPFLTTKHSLEFCLAYAERAAHEGFPSLVVLGGDKSIGPPRCVNHAWELRAAIRAHVPELVTRRLGQSSRRCGDAGGLSRRVAHHRRVLSHAGGLASRRGGGRGVQRRIRERQRINLPGIFGVFYYRSAIRGRSTR